MCDRIIPLILLIAQESEALVLMRVAIAKRKVTILPIHILTIGEGELMIREIL